MKEINRELARALKLPRIRHMGFIVKDIDKAIRHYSDTFRLGPWFRTTSSKGGENYLRGEQRIDTTYETASTFSGSESRSGKVVSPSI